MPPKQASPAATTAILLAAGRGTRMARSVGDKILAPLAGRPVFVHSLETFVSAEVVDSFVIVYRDAGQRARLEAMYRSSGAQNHAVQWVRGGRQRQDSVSHALRVLSALADCVLIHDCARPLVTEKALQQVAAAVRRDGAACLAHRITDTIKRMPPKASDARRRRFTTIDRERLWGMETPQGFRRDLIARAYDEVSQRRLTITDDAAALELTTRHPLTLVENHAPNPKITRPSDLAYAEFLLQSRRRNDA